MAITGVPIDAAGNLLGDVGSGLGDVGAGLGDLGAGLLGGAGDLLGGIGDLAAGPLAPLLFLGTTLLSGLLGGGPSTSTSNANANANAQSNASVSQGQTQSQQQGIQGNTNNAGLAALGGSAQVPQMPFVTGPPPDVPTMAVPQVPMNRF
jgi:hypothetical protein